MNCPACGAANIEGVDECESCQEPLTDIPALASPKRGMERRVLDGTVADLSPKSAIVVKAGQSLREAVEVMRAAKVGCALVIEEGHLSGVISEREILMKGGDLSGPVSGAMRANPTVLREDDQVAEAFNRMAMSGHLHVPIQNRGGYAVISARDLLRYLCK